MNLKAPYNQLFPEATLNGTIAYQNTFFAYLYFRGRYGYGWVFVFDTPGGMSLTNCVEQVCALIAREIEAKDSTRRLNSQALMWIQQDSQNQFFQLDFSENRELLMPSGATKVTRFQDPVWTPIDSKFWLVYPFFTPQELLELRIK